MAVPTLELTTPYGLARAHLHRPSGRATALVLVLHGAGTDSGRPPLPLLAEALAAAGLLAVRFDQPYVVAGRRAPAPAAHLDAALLAALPALRTLAPAGPLGLVGRSSGARVGCRTAAEAGTAAIAALGFPFRPPGRGGVPRPDRGPELRAAGAACPVLVVQGERDPFGRPARTRGVRTRMVAGMGHPPTDAAALLAGRWIAAQLAVVARLQESD